MKRIIDFSAALAGLAVLAPLLLLIALLIKLDSPGPVFFRGLRVGKGARPFRILKFRTMGAEAERQGPGITTANDPRVTGIGRRLRRTKLDELPQLINVLKGEMSLVGPRPEDPAYVGLYTPEQKRVLSVAPGITSPASLAFRNEEALLQGPDWKRQYVETVLPRKLEIELEYIEKRSLVSDMVLVFRTILGMFG